jgi:rod shape-determining protein MreB and related proteins
MLSHLQPIIYIQISPERLAVRNVKTGEAISEVPEVAISRKGKEAIVGVGDAARSMKSSTTIVTNPFGHPRSLVSDFTVAEQLLKHFLRRINRSSLFALSPKVVMHPLGDPDGGFTQIEIRALMEMSLGAGASQVVLWQGRPLSDQELLSGMFPSSGKVLS